MGSKAILSSLKKIGGVHNPKTKSTERSGSDSLPEGCSETIAPNPAAPGSHTTPVHVDPVVEEIEVEEVELQNKRKRLRKASEKSPATEESGPDGIRVGNYSIKEVGKVLSRFPTSEDWARMGQSSQKDNLKELLGVWGQAGILLAGLAANSEKQENYQEALQTARKVIQEKNDAIQKLQDEICALKLSHEDALSGLEDARKKADENAATAETKAELLGKEVDRLNAELNKRRPEEDVISDFKNSSDYESALADAAASKIYRTWLVAERYIKTTPDSNWDGFVDIYGAAEESIENGGAEPEPYDGPNPVIPQSSAPVGDNPEG